MRNNYVGDIGDFANNGLLRYLCGVTGPTGGNPLRLGVIWYLNNSPDAAGNETGYLNVSDYNECLYRECDPVLYDKLRTLVGKSLLKGLPRTIQDIEKGNILPANTLYYPVVLNDSPRDEWLNNALKKISKADLLFINPDTGIASKAQERNIKPTHVTVGELARFFEEGKSLIIYQHTGQGRGTVRKRIESNSERLKCELKLSSPPLALWWHRVSGRVYFIVAQPKHKRKIEARIKKFLKGPWGTNKPRPTAEPHFTPAYPPRWPMGCS